MMLRFLMVVYALIGWISVYAQNYPFRNTSLSFEQRAEDLVSRLTLTEKLSLMQNESKPVERLGIPAYNWWNECLHGVARDGEATVFPQAIGIASSWNSDLVFKVADAISTEARAKHQEHIRNNERGIYQGLTMWTPNINIFRDPRWGRGQETYGEDPFLTSRTGVAFVKGLQGNDPRYFKVIATAKHYAVHSGSEINRHTFNAVVSKQDLYDTYLPAFENLVKKGKVYSIMGAYNRLYGVPACASKFLLDTLLRKKWGFQGYVVSDCGAITDIYSTHKYAKTQAEASALAVQAGCDLTCGGEYIAIANAVKDGIISEKEIDIAVKRLMLGLFKLGMFDSQEQVAYQRIPYTANNTKEHGALSKRMALESMVLLQNKNNILPLSKNLKNIAIVGPYAADTAVLRGNYSGHASAPVTFLRGIKDKLSAKTNIITNNAIHKPEHVYKSEKSMSDSIAVLVESCENVDVVIFCGGISADVEGEESPLVIKGFFHGDRTSLTLPDDQVMALKALKEAGKKVILVMTNGSAMELNWEHANLDGILDAWYPGQEGGHAVADILFGDYNPAGRLPLTFYKSVDDLPEFEDYNMEGRTYKYFKKDVLYPFGYGLSYSSFRYNNLSLSKDKASASDSIKVSLTIKNESKRDGDEVVQVYASSNIKEFRPNKTLIGYQRLFIKAGESKKVEIVVDLNDLRQYSEIKNEYIVHTGTYTIEVGASSDNIKQKKTVNIN